MQESQLIVVTGVPAEEELVVIQSNTDCHSSKEHLGDFVHLPVKFGREASESRENVIW